MGAGERSVFSLTRKTHPYRTVMRDQPQNLVGGDAECHEPHRAWDCDAEGCRSGGNEFPNGSEDARPCEIAGRQYRPRLETVLHYAIL